MLAVHNLVKVYPGSVVALQDITLQVDKGMFGLLGPNGAGKSTLMKILAGLLEPTSGRATFFGDDIIAQPERVWARLGYLPQDFGFYPHLTGEAMLAYLLRLKGIQPPGGMKRYCAALLEQVNLTFARNRKVKTYSGGMRQRLGIAQALAGNPQLLIVDEPTAGLDPEERFRFYQLLSELAQERIVLLSTHIVEDVAVLCSRFAVLCSGKLIAVTSPCDACSALDGTLFDGHVSADELPELQKTHHVTRAYFMEGKLRVRLHLADRSPPAMFHPATPTLEDAYLIMIRKHGEAA